MSEAGDVRHDVVDKTGIPALDMKAIRGSECSPRGRRHSSEFCKKRGRPKARLFCRHDDSQNLVHDGQYIKISDVRIIPYPSAI